MDRILRTPEVVKATGAIEDYDLASRAERGLPRSGEAWESRHPLDWLA